MINCIVVEDEPLAQQVLTAHIEKVPELVLLKTCNNALEAFEMLHTNTVELIFLDIKMPALNGIDFVKSLKNPPAIIFTTAFTEYAAESYDLAAVDYLLKPITFERFASSIHKFLKLYVPTEDEKDHTFFKVNGKFIKIAHGDLIYAQSIKDYVIIYTATGNYITHMTMKYLTDLLPVKPFRRIHRSFLVNGDKITSIGKDVVILGNIEVPIGKSYKKDRKR